MMSKYETVIDARGQAGNTLMIVGCAGRMLRELREPDADISALYANVMNAPSRAAALDAVRAYFPVVTEDD